MSPEEVRGRDDLVRFLAHLSANVDSFENKDLAVYLEAASGWLGDMDGWFRNRGEEVPNTPSWSLLARVLRSATIYE